MRAVPLHPPPYVHLLAVWAVLAATPAGAQGARVVPELVLSQPVLQLERLSGFAVGPDGVTAAWDRSSGRVNLFGPDGGLKAAFGRTGEGPGDSRFLGAGGWLKDTLWILDPVLRRTTFFAQKGTLLRIARWPTDVTARGSREALVVRPVGHAPGAYLADGTVLLLTPLRLPGTNLPSGMASLPIVSNSGEVVADGPSVPFGAPDSSCTTRWRSATSSGGFSDPFCPTSMHGISNLAGVVASVRVLDSRRGTNSIEHVVQTVTGQVLSKTTHASPQVKVAAAVRDSVHQQSNPARRGRPAPPPEAVSAWKTMRISATYPPVSLIHVGYDSVSWLSRHHEPNGAIEWMRIDAAGKRLPSVTLPSGERLVAVGRDLAWTVSEDADGLPRITRFRVVSP